MKTKLNIIIISILLLASSCAPVKYIKGTKMSDKKEMKNFLKGLESVALSKHYTLLMDYMDEEFLENSHDNELEGNDLVFVDEIFTGYDIKTNEYHCMHQKDITSFETIQVNQIDAITYKAKFKIGDTHSIIDCNLLIKKTVEQGKTKYGITKLVD